MSWRHHNVISFGVTMWSTGTNSMLVVDLFCRDCRTHCHTHCRRGLRVQSTLKSFGVSTIGVRHESEIKALGLVLGGERNVYGRSRRPFHSAIDKALDSRSESNCEQKDSLASSCPSSCPRRKAHQSRFLQCSDFILLDRLRYFTPFLLCPRVEDAGERS